MMRVYAAEVEAAVFDCLIKNLKDEKELAKNAITLAQKKNERGSYLENRRGELKAEFRKIALHWRIPDSFTAEEKVASKENWLGRRAQAQLSGTVWQSIASSSISSSSNGSTSRLLNAFAIGRRLYRVKTVCTADI